MSSIHVSYPKRNAICCIKLFINMLSIGSHESNAVLQWSCGTFAHLTSYILHMVILLYNYIQYTT